MAYFLKQENNIFIDGNTVLAMGKQTEGVDTDFYFLENTQSNLYENGNIVDCDDERLYFINKYSGSDAGISIVNLSNLSLVGKITYPSCISVRVDKQGGRIFASSGSAVKVFNYNDFSVIANLSISSVYSIDYDADADVIIFGNAVRQYTDLSNSLGSLSSIVNIKGVKFDLGSQLFVVSGTGNTYSLIVLDYSFNQVASLSYAQTGGSSRYRGMIFKDGYLGLQCSNGLRFLPLNNITNGYDSAMNINVGGTYVTGMCYDKTYNRIFYSYFITSTSNKSVIRLFTLK